MPESLLFQGKTTYPQKNSFAILISPFAQIKKLFQSLYFFILKIMWSELIYGEKKENEWAGILLFFLFLFLSWLTYLGQVYFTWVLTSFFIAWYVDYGLAKSDYQKGKYNIPIYLLHGDGDRLIWESKFPNQPLVKIEFNWAEIREIRISQSPVYGGAFQDKVGKVWQISLRKFDGTEWIIDEAKNVPKALYQAKIFQQWVNVPIVFNESQGLGNYAEFILQDDMIASQNKIPLIFSPHQHPENYGQYQVVKEAITKNYLKYLGVNLKTNDHKWHIYSVWKLRNSWQLLKQIVQDSGFIIFILIMSRVMLICGSIIDHGLVNETIGESSVNFFLSSGTFFSVAIAVVIMIYKGWQLSRVKHCFLDHHFLKVMLDNKILGKLKLTEIEAVLLLTDPEPEILVFTLKDAIILPKLQRKEDSQFYVRCLQEGIDYFQKPNQPT